MAKAEPVHGHWELHLDGDVMVCHYGSGFNIAGVNAITRDMVALASSLDNWVLLQIPAADTGITFEAIEPMYHGYLALQAAGCLAVGIVDNSPFVRAGNFNGRPELSMPIRIDDRQRALEEWLASFSLVQ